jgi:hypothetical protein
VPEQRLLSPKIGLRQRRRCGTLSRKTPTDLGFSRRRLLIGGGKMLEGTMGAHTMWWHGPGGAPPYGVATSWSPLRLFFGLCHMSGENRNFGLRFVQFREYFLCNFSET